MDQKSTGTIRRWWIGVVVLALVGGGLRAALVAWLPAQPVDDFWSYLARAANLLDAGVYGPFPDRPDAAFPPAYSLLLAGALALGGDAVISAKLVNALLGIASVLLAGQLGRRLGGLRAGLAAAALVALLPRGILEAQILASENLLQPLVYAYLLLALPSPGSTRSLRRAALAGALIGLATLTRVAAYGLWVLWPIGAWLSGRRGALREVALLLLALHAVLLPWAMRNRMTLGGWRWLTSTGGVNLFIGYHDGATGAWTPWWEELSRARPGLDRRDVLAVDSAAAETAREWILNHPLQAAKLAGKKLRLLLFEGDDYVVFYSVSGRGGAPFPESREVVSISHPLKESAKTLERILGMAYLATVGAGLLGLFRAWRGSDRERSGGSPAVSWLGGGALYFVLIGAVFFSATRFRWPAIDLLTVAAALGLCGIESASGGRIGGVPPAEREHDPADPAARK